MAPPATIRKCIFCDAVIPGGMEGHYDHQDPANIPRPTKLFCCRKCYYEDYVRQPPKSLFDKNVIAPAFELAGAPIEVRVRVMLAFDEWIHQTAAMRFKQHHRHDVFFTSVIKRFQLESWQHLLINILCYGRVTL